MNVTRARTARTRSRPLAAVLAVALVTPMVVSTSAPAAAAELEPQAVGVIADFEGGTDPELFVYDGGGATIATSSTIIGEDDDDARPGQVGDNEALEVTYEVPEGGWAGFGQSFEDVGPLDLRGTEGMRLWLQGSGSGASFQVELQENRADPEGPPERWNVEVVDDVDGWRLVELPWEDFSRGDFQEPGAPDDGLTLDEVWGWAIPLGATDGPVTLRFDDVGVVPHRVDDFEETELFQGTDPNGIAIGFSTFSDGSGVAINPQVTPPGPILPHLGDDNQVLAVDLDVTGFAGFVHSFTDGTEWVPQDWSEYAGFGFWLHGHGSGTNLFVDLLEDRNPGSTTDDAQRWTATFVDDTPGWHFRFFAFEDLVVKGIGNGAPTTDLTLQEVHGWAFGSLATDGPVTFHLDDVVLLGSAGDRPLTVGFAATNTTVTEGGTAQVPVRVSRPLADDADPVTVTYTTEPGTGQPDVDYVPTSGQLTFEPGGPTEQTFAVETVDDEKPLGDRTAIVRLTAADGAPLGTAQGRVTIRDDDPVDPALIDDIERNASAFVPIGDAEREHVVVTSDDPDARPDQASREGMLRVEVDGTEAPPPPDPTPAPRVSRQLPCWSPIQTIVIHGSDDLAVSSIDHRTVRVGEASELRRVGKFVLRQVRDVDRDGHRDLVVMVWRAQTGLPCAELVDAVTALTWTGEPVFPDPDGDGPDEPEVELGGVSRTFPEPRDMSGAEGIAFWYRGSGSGDDVTFRLQDDRAPDPGPDGWELVWSDEFEGPAGSPPDPENWSYEIGDGTANGIPGWGNDELQYYTDDPRNVALDGDGHLVITVEEEDGDLQCYYGDCQYSSARLLSQHKQEFMFGRVEARVQVPFGDGLWPAFWMLGTDIGEVGWPQTGEIDVLEFVGREPYEVFGTIHGPGYSGGQSFGNTFTTDDPVYEDFHEFAVEWQPGHIIWEFNGERFHEAVPADVAPNEWVFDHPFFLLLNVAVGGNFGGPVGPDTTFPQEMVVDFVRVYSAPDTAERFETTFTDDVDGWTRIEVPFTALERSADQPAGAPDNGLTLTEVWGYELVTSGPATFLLDDVRVLQDDAVVVTSTADAGPGSLRAAVANVAAGGTVAFDPDLAGQTITLTSGAIPIASSVTVDASDAPGLTIDAAGASRVFTVAGGVQVHLEGLTLRGGSHGSRGGAIHVAGSLELVDVTVRDSQTGGDPGDFEAGGGGIYVATDGRLALTEVTVADNATTANGAGIWAGFGSEVSISRSTLSGNVAGNVGGALRTLGDLEVVNSTIVGNTSTAWHGGALFHTDGTARILSSTVVDNVSADGTAAMLAANFGAPATLELGDNAISGGSGPACAAEGSVTITSLGGNVATDATCAFGADDAVVDDLGLGDLGDNGGSTLTTLPDATSPVLDAADAGRCPATDQRGVSRPQGDGCDAGAVEREAP